MCVCFKFGRLPKPAVLPIFIPLSPPPIVLEGLFVVICPCRTSSFHTDGPEAGCIRTMGVRGVYPQLGQHPQPMEEVRPSETLANACCLPWPPRIELGLSPHPI